MKLLPRNLIVLLGAYDLSNVYETGRLGVSAKKILLHDDWSPHAFSYDADIALIQLEDNVPSTQYIRPVCVLTPTNDLHVTESIVVGWGQSEDKSRRHERIPKQVNVKSITNEECFLEDSDFTTICSTRTFCAGSTQADTGVCFGDSGGGLIV